MVYSIKQHPLAWLPPRAKGARTVEIEIDESMAHVILGALAVCDAEGIDGVENVYPVGSPEYVRERERAQAAKLRLLDALRSAHPSIVRIYRGPRAE